MQRNDEGNDGVGLNLYNVRCLLLAAMRNIVIVESIRSQQQQPEQDGNCLYVATALRALIAVLY